MSSTPTVEDLRAQIADHQATLDTHERDIGRATLAGKSITALTKNAQDARAGIEACEAAVAELERQQAEADEEARRGTASQRRAAEYRWIAEHMRRAAAVLEAQRAARAAEDALVEHGNDPATKRLKRIWLGMDLNYTPRAVDLETDLVIRTPNVPRFPAKSATGRERPPLIIGSPDFSLEWAEQVAARAEELAAAEDAGEGQDYSDVEGTATRINRERREAARAERKARQEREREERARAIAEAGERVYEPPRGALARIGEPE